MTKLDLQQLYTESTVTIHHMPSHLHPPRLSYASMNSSVIAFAIEHSDEGYLVVNQKGRVELYTYKLTTLNLIAVTNKDRNITIDTIRILLDNVMDYSRVHDKYNRELAIVWSQLTNLPHLVPVIR